MFLEQWKEIYRKMVEDNQDFRSYMLSGIKDLENATTSIGKQTQLLLDSVFLQSVAFNAAELGLLIYLVFRVNELSKQITKGNK